MDTLSLFLYCLCASSSSHLFPPGLLSLPGSSPVGTFESVGISLAVGRMEGRGFRCYYSLSPPARLRFLMVHTLLCRMLWCQTTAAVVFRYAIFPFHPRHFPLLCPLPAAPPHLALSRPLPVVAVIRQ